jgi:glycosyltransferase involved in cell wall biosynthesis
LLHFLFMNTDTPVSIAIPSRNNIKYVKSAYQSIREHVAIRHEIILLDDASTDGTWEWMNEIKKSDNDVIIYKNDGPDRAGHVFLYDKAAEMCSCEIFSIFHADMIASPNYIKNAIKHIGRGVVVCSTRVEPEIHPPGPEKITKNLGLEPEDFEIDDFISFCRNKEIEYKDKVTEGFFAPWFIFKEDFLSIGGHDKKLFCPMELDDSDIGNRFLLAGYKLIQARDSLVYHMTCRGSRFKDGIEIERVIDLPNGGKWYKPKDSEEYIKLRQIKFREWWRKWHSDVLHDALLKPIVYPRYDVGLRIRGRLPSLEIIKHLEPWFDNIEIDYAVNGIEEYIKEEQRNSAFNMSDKFRKLNNDVIVEISGGTLTQYMMETIKNLSLMLQEAGEPGVYELDDFRVTINRLADHSDKLIKNEDFYRWKGIN